MRLSATILAMIIDSYLSGVYLVVGSTVLSILGLLVARRILHSQDLISTHDVGGYLLSVVGTMYAVILGLIVVEAMANFDEARTTVQSESNALADILLLSRRMPEPRRGQIRGLALAYAKHVIEDEWPILDQGRYAPEARRTALELVDAVTGFEPGTESQQQLYAAALTAACELWNHRRIRILTAEHGIPALEWFLLLAGGVITVGFTYFFKLDHLRIQVLMTGMVTAIIAMSLFLVLMFGYPFSGELKVSPQSFNIGQVIADHQTGPQYAQGR